jgi:hypothetical protein
MFQAQPPVLASTQQSDVPSLQLATINNRNNASSGQEVAQFPRQQMRYFIPPTRYLSSTNNLRNLSKSRSKATKVKFGKLGKSLTRYNLTKVELCLTKSNFAAGPTVANADKCIKEWARTIRNLKHLTDLSLKLTDLPESLAPKTLSSLAAAIKSLSQLISLSMLIKHKHQKYFDLIVSHLDRLNHLRILAMEFTFVQGMWKESTVKLNEAKEVVALRLDYSFAQMDVEFLQRLSVYFMQLPHLTRLDLTMRLENIRLEIVNPMCLALLVEAMRHLSSMKELNLNFGCRVSWVEIKTLLSLIKSLAPLKQISIYFGCLGETELNQVKQSMLGIFPNWMVTTRTTYLAGLGRDGYTLVVEQQH